MTMTTDILDDVRSDIAPMDPSLVELRRRRDCVLVAGRSFPGVKRTYRSGGLAMAVANSPLTDSDGGLVLNRQVYTSLGPNGDGDLPFEIVELVQEHIGPLIRIDYPKATVSKMKRGLIVRCHEPLPSGEDPTVDLVIALNRRNAQGLWIPNMKQGRWDPADPECHVRMMLAGPASIRRTRAHVVRIAKCWNHGLARPAVCSFNLVALALAFFATGGDLGIRTTEFFEYAAAALRAGLTEDPAGVSGTIKTPNGKDLAVKRSESAAMHLRAALDTEGDVGRVTAELAEVFPVNRPGLLGGS